MSIGKNTAGRMFVIPLVKMILAVTNAQCSGLRLVYF